MKIILGLIGLVLLVASLYLNSKLANGEKLAKSADDETKIYGMIDENAPLPCSWEVVEPDRVMGEDKSQAISIDVKGLTDVECSSTISLRAPSFNMSPREESQTVKLASNQKDPFRGLFLLKKTGSYEIAVSDPLNTKVLGVTVTDTFGLTAIQAKVVSILGTLFGPMLTVPWWWDKFKSRKPKIEVKE